MVIRAEASTPGGCSRQGEASQWLGFTGGLLDGGGLRRRQPAAGEEGNGDEATRGRFPSVRASTRLRELDAIVGLGGTTPSEAGDERVLRSSGGDGGEHTASEGDGWGGAG
uniref:Epstein-Barr virus EBNA-1-like n=1 Tax=Oryza sativa subsp. japonica TaxID=39947 RepID=Q5Z9J7_ORYSJ|nr:Epstein-Barr virus EBNA-1-like [Oryza sativa Japonica Group]